MRHSGEARLLRRRALQALLDWGGVKLELKEDIALSGDPIPRGACDIEAFELPDPRWECNCRMLWPLELDS